MRLNARIVMCLLLMLVLIVAANAQPIASAVGTVRDSSGAVVKDAKVTALQPSTGFSRSATTDSLGNYALPALSTGVYQFTAEMSGFKKSVASNVTLEVAQQARVDFDLQPGNVATTMEVTAAPSLLSTETSSVGQVVDNKKIVDLPLNGRDFTQLATLTPGVLSAGGGEVTGFSTLAGPGGQRSKTEFLLDGMSNQEQLFDGAQITPSIDAIQEFRVQSNAFSAEYGRGSLVVNATIKGGTNEYHGTAFEFFRNDKLDARNYFAQTRPPRRQNQFGGSFGGPIKKNKLFFFLNYEGLRLRQPLTRNSRVPSAAFWQGNFSSLSTPVKDPLTGLAFPGNQVPSNRISPVATYFQKFIPLPNTVQGNDTFYVWNASASNDSNQGNGRMDYLIGEKDNLYLRYSINNSQLYSPGGLPNSGGVTQGLRSQNAVLGETHVFSPRLVNEFRFGYARLYSSNDPQGLGTNYTVESGIRGFEQTSQNFPGFPGISVNTYGDLISGNAFAPIVNPTNTYMLTDSATWTLGRHTVKFGIDFRRFHLSSTNSAFSRGSLSFNGQFSGNPFADFLIGNPISGIRDFPRNYFGLQDNNYHFFVQDDIKVSSKLTMNVGLRYELDTVPSADLAQASTFDQKTGKWITAVLPDGNINLTTQQVAPLAYAIYKNSIVTARDAGLPDRLQTISKKNFAPRVGFAYRPFNNDRTVVRAGYGIFYLLQRGNEQVSTGLINLPFILDEFKFSGGDAQGRPVLNSQNFFDAPFGFGGPLLSAIDLNLRPPYMQQWNIAVQRQLVNNLALDVAYVGNKGTRLERNQPFNYALPIPGSFNNSGRAFPQYGDGTWYSNGGNSIYHGLQVKLEKRYSQGLSFLASYTYSRFISDVLIQTGGIQDPSNLSGSRGLADLDVPHRLVTSFTYALPVGKGRTFGSNWGRVTDSLLGGWNLSGIVQFQSGTPFSPSMNAQPSNNNWGPRPNRVADGRIDSPSFNQWFDPSAFTIPAQYTYGNAGRNILRAPGINNWDLSLLKNFTFTERKYLQFRLETFNTFNHTQGSYVDSNIQSGTAGRVLGARDPRVVQLGLKFYF